MSEPRPLHEIAHDILNEAYGIQLNTGKTPAWVTYATPYLRAMQRLGTVTDNYGADSGESITLYALSNMSSWRGEAARRLKAELNLHLKGTKA